MDVTQAAALARHLMNQHGLADWQFRFDHARRRFGCCWPTLKRITLSRPLAELNDIAEVTDTILHEIAHALVPGGHSAAWKRMCLRIGAKPRRCYSQSAVILPRINRKHRYVAACPCAIEHVRKRRPTLVYICRRCRTKLRWMKQNLNDRLLAPAAR
jgi:predicted SprT family Zn-dependent metalloprotease